MVRWRKEKHPTDWVGQMWHDYPWTMRWARVRYEARVLSWWIIRPRTMWLHRHVRRQMMSSTPEQDKKNVGRPKEPKQPRPPKEYRDEQ